MQRFTRMTRTLAAGAALSMLAVACGGDNGTTDADGDAAGSIAEDYDLDGLEVRVASKDFAEQLILGQLAKVAMEAAGAEVEITENLPSPDGARNALLAGDADVAWEYTGTAWTNYLGNDEPIDDPIEQWEAVARDDLAENGVFWTEPAPFDNTYGFAYPNDLVDERRVETVTDLAEFVEANPGEATLCVDSTFASRDDGLPRIEEVYDFEWDRDLMFESDFGVIYTSVVDQDPCIFAEVFTTDGSIVAEDLFLIEDDQNGFISYLSSVQMMEDFANDNPQLAELFQEITADIDEATMTALNAEVDVDGEFPEDVAENYLREQGFIG